MGCKFCASGLLGLKRHLTTGEIIGQILSAEAIAGKRVNNIVFMGMGEPLSNFDNVVDALEIITSHRGLEIGARHITISTSGFVPGLKKLAAYPRQIRLAVSLHGATDEVRDQIMPVNKKWPLSQLIPALEEWSRGRNQMPTLEYILIRDINDSPKDASHLVRLAKRLHAKVNLIPYNTVEGLPWKRPSEERCRSFRDAVHKARIPVTMRYEKGHDINAACGQLRLRKEQEKNGEQPRGRQQNVFRQNRGEKHGASKQMQQVEFECRHRQQGGKQKLPAPFQLQRQNSAAKNVNRQQCSENQNHMSLS